LVPTIQQQCLKEEDIVPLETPAGYAPLDIASIPAFLARQPDISARLGGQPGDWQVSEVGAPKQARIERLDESDSAFPAVRAEIRAWAQNCSLARDPEMPSSLRNRAADNCRPLLAIADSLGHGEAARTALLELYSNRPDEDPGVSLLADIGTVFLARGVDRIGSKDLVEAMLELEDAVLVWAEWRGVNDDRSPHKLTQSELARLLQPFGIRSKTIWPPARKASDRSCRGYTRDQFEAAWAAYCPTAGTATQSSKIIGLLRS
jgi:hypothetical protein